ncbi:MAG: SusF/SusE family outer membrane protein [Mediterranea sp.]|nr:SusF/SusE family outer membrane protein [Mediterranea sp.]
MKKIFQYMTAFLLILTVGSGCEDNDNWKIVTDVQPGVYVTGDALIYSAVATSSALKAVTQDMGDNAVEASSVTGIYTWIKSGGGFTILKIDAEGNEVSYGKGAVVASSPFETVSLQVDGPAFTVPSDGLYYVVTNNADNQVTIIPAQFGIIGDATAGGWNSETVMSPSFDENQALVELKLTNTELDKKSMKFRYHDWGIEVPYGGGTVKFHSNMGGLVEAVSLGATLTECEAGGEDFAIDQRGMYEITLQLDLRTGTFKAKAVRTGDSSAPVMPENMYMIGSPWDWNWDNVGEGMVKTHVDGKFWSILYLPVDADIKFCPVKAWDGDFGFSAANLSQESIDRAGLSDSGGNIKVGTAGWYLIVVTTSPSDGSYTVEFLEPEIWLVGDVASGGWSPGSNAADKFTVPADATGEFVSPAFVSDGNLRMSVVIPGADWWQTEFNIIGGAIAYRGNGGDQESVPVTAGQKAYLKFSDGTGRIQ